MSPNKELPHVLVLPEDDANRQLANGFHQQVPPNRQRQMQVLRPADGWAHVMGSFLSDHVACMTKYPQRFMVLILDCDNDESRIDRERAKIPGSLRQRVFILGTLSEPEALKREVGALGYEAIGSALADDCQKTEIGPPINWQHHLLRINASELERLRETIKPILFLNV